jgi:hypothetical protein
VTNREQGGFNTEPTPERPGIDRAEVFSKLTSPELTETFGFDVTIGDVAWLNEETFSDDDEELLEWLVSLAAQNGVDYEEFLEWLGIQLELEQETE